MVTKEGSARPQRQGLRKVRGGSAFKATAAFCLLWKHLSLQVGEPTLSTPLQVLLSGIQISLSKT